MEIQIQLRSKVSSETEELIRDTVKDAVKGYMSRSEPSLITPTKIDGLYLVMMIQDGLCKVLEAASEERWKEVYQKAQKMSNDPRMN